MSEISINLCELRKQGIKMLLEIKEIFDEYGLEYWLDYGTLLGAVRTGSVIPWDGEFDLSTWDDNIDIDSEIWEKIQSKGYIVKTGKYNIKIWRKNWQVGTFNVDLHRYRRFNNEAIYLYGYGTIPQNNILLKSHQKFLNLLKSFKKISADHRCSFIDIYKLIKENTDYPIKDIDTEDIIFRLGKYYYEPFSLEINNRKIKMKTLSNIKHPVTKKILFIISFLPLWIIDFLHSVIEIISKVIKRSYSSRVNVPEIYFDNLTSIKFCGVDFKCPEEKEKYLERTYGKDWRVPKSEWIKSIDSPTFRLPLN
tara:strand:+ start:177 stop:1103 length:927 start_codon:yes stop_codon:yes gene_type:complete